jgi:hypothetical protein
MLKATLTKTVDRYEQSAPDSPPVPFTQRWVAQNHLTKWRNCLHHNYECCRCGRDGRVKRLITSYDPSASHSSQLTMAKTEEHSWSVYHIRGPAAQFVGISDEEMAIKEAIEEYEIPPALHGNLLAQWRD